MSAMFRVQKGVPIPPVNRHPKQPRSKWPIEAMDIGDFFFVPQRSSRQVRSYVSHAMQGRTLAFTVRSVCAVQLAQGDWKVCDERVAGAVEGVGVWRTK